MGVELAPVKAMLDERHLNLPTSRDINSYTLGRIGEHNVVIAIMPKIGNNKAIVVATQLLNDFRSIRFGLLVGIGMAYPGTMSSIFDLKTSWLASQQKHSGGLCSLIGERFTPTGDSNVPELWGNLYFSKQMCRA